MWPERQSFLPCLQIHASVDLAKKYGACLQLKLELICCHKRDRYLIFLMILGHLQKINVNYRDF
jgi:hypothetical protein